MLLLTKKMKFLWWIYVGNVPTECCIVYFDGSISKGNATTVSETNYRVIKQKGNLCPSLRC